MPTLIHQRVRAAHEGRNPTVICRMSSGWLVLGDNQRLRGYSLLLSDPVATDINALAPQERAAFCRDMVLIGDALLEVTGAQLINYMVLGNLDRALHAHIHPRYANEPDQTRRTGPWAYQEPQVPFDLQRDGALMQQIAAAVERRLAARSCT
jgi:diadenosine tetraphosphate (Ap4A) HIT family hydrolase